MCAQSDCIVVGNVNEKEGTHDVHMFSVNHKWANNLQMCGEGGVITLGKDFKTDN